MICRNARNSDDADAGGADHGRQSPYLGSAGRPQLVAVLGNLDDPAGREVDHQDEDPDKGAYKQQLRQAGMEKFLDVGEPFLVEPRRNDDVGSNQPRREAKGENGGVHWHPMILLERWATVALLSLGLASTAGAPAQSPAGKAQQKHPAQAVPELPPWDSAQPPPPIRPPSPDDAPLEPDPDPDPPAPSEDTAKPAVASQPAPATQPAPAPAPPANPAPRQEAVAPPAEEVPTLPPSSDPAQRQMEKDTARLLQLVRELKVEVNKAGSNTLSLAALQKTDEIQRLVKSLKEQMRERGQIVVKKP